MKVEAILVEKTSKAGKPYKALEVTINGKIRKLVFLSDAELELIKLTSISK